MAKLTKKQRREQRKRKRVASRNAMASIPRQKPWVAPKMKLFEAPRLFPDDLPLEKRIEAVREIGAKSGERFEQIYPKIATWFHDYDPLYILSYCALYFVSQPEGIDPEAFGETIFYHHYLEIMQAFSLGQVRSFSVNPLFKDARRLMQDMKEIGELMQLRLLNIPPELTTDDELKAYYLRTEMMSHTIAIRNWAYHHQMLRVVLSLANLISEDFKSLYDIDPVCLMQMLFDLLEERNKLLNEHLDKVRNCFKAGNYKKIIEAYNAAFPENTPIEGEAVGEIWKRVRKNKNNLKALLIAHADLKLHQIYSFTLEHAQSVMKDEVSDDILKRTLDHLSYQFGDLKEFKKEHFILANPVLSRPFIRTEDRTYFSAIWGVLPHIALDLLEDLIWPNKRIRNTYTRAKAKFLESEVEQMFRTAFPSALVYRGSQWHDNSTSKLYENDLLVVLDTFAIIVEAKSGIVSDPARRGAPGRLFETLRELTEEPSEQALRLIQHLEKNPKEHSFNTKQGTINVVDTRKIKYYIPLGVTLSNLGFISSNLKQLIEAKVVDKQIDELAPSMCFTDLEAIFDLLPIEIQKIHYLARRREFEAHMLYDGDELDLLAFYLENGFNIGEAEYSKEVGLHMGLKSKELDPYFIGSSEGKRVLKPMLSMTKWWDDILKTISDRKMDGWVETGFILLNTAKEDQAKFELMFKELMLRIKQGKVDKQHNWVQFLSGPERRRYLIVGYPYETTDKSIRDAVISEIISDENFGEARGCVVIGVQMDRLDYPYSVLARRISTNLFDTLTS